MTRKEKFFLFLFLSNGQEIIVNFLEIWGERIMAILMLNNTEGGCNHKTE
jgi:hypothetical protein